MFSFKNKTVFLTGATGGIGKEIALKMSSLGARVIGISDRIISKPSNYDVNFYEVSKQVNNPKNNFSSLTEEIC